MSDFTREEILAKVAAKESLKGADLRGANLRWANLRGANLRGADLREAKYNANTKWPEGFDPVTAGTKLVEVDD